MKGDPYYYIVYFGGKFMDKKKIKEYMGRIKSSRDRMDRDQEKVNEMIDAVIELYEPKRKIFQEIARKIGRPFSEIVKMMSCEEEEEIYRSVERKKKRSRKKASEKALDDKDVLSENASADDEEVSVCAADDVQADPDDVSDVDPDDDSEIQGGIFGGAL